MILARIIGTAVATVKHPVYDGHKVMVVETISPDGTPDGENSGSTFLSVDFQHAGVGDTVLVSREGNASRQLFGDDNAPVHSVILGIVDDIEIQKTKDK